MRISLLLIAMLLSAGAFAQKVYTKSASVKFLSETPIENIEAVSNQVACVVDLSTGDMQWSALIKAFRFEKALMQEHFNENYMESDEYPKAVFTGSISKGNVDWMKDGEYPVEVTGTLDMHGVKNEIVAPGVIYIRDGEISTSSEFIVRPEDYDIKIPKVVRENIAKEVKVYVQAPLQKL